jgi:hypothetical protein
LSDHLAEFWKWARTAPLPVVLALTLALGGWVWAIAADQQAEKVRVDGVVKQGDRLESKIDRLIDIVADLRAEARVTNANVAASLPSPSPSPSTQTVRPRSVDRDKE